MKKVFSILTLVIIMVSILSVPAMADDWSQYNPGGTLSPTSEGTLAPTDGTTSKDVTIPGRDSLIDNDQSTQIRDGYIDVMPVVSTDDILQWAVTKGNEIIYLLQVICQPFAIIIFIISAFITLVGAIGKGDLVGKGIFGMIIACVVYAAALYAPVILQTFVGWVAS